MELIDIVDENGSFTGIIMDKEEAHNKNLLHNEISIFIINNKNQILLQKRSASKRFHPNKLGLCSGHVDSGESVENAALRELKEEVGIEILPNLLIPFGKRKIYKKEINSHITYFYYTEINMDETDFIIQTEELSEVKWFDIDVVINKIKEHDNSITLQEDRLYLLEELKKMHKGE